MLGREIEAYKKGVKVSVRESLKGELLVFHREIQGSTDSSGRRYFEKSRIR